MGMRLTLSNIASATATMAIVIPAPMEVYVLLFVVFCDSLTINVDDIRSDSSFTVLVSLFMQRTSVNNGVPSPSATLQ